MSLGRFIVDIFSGGINSNGWQPILIFVVVVLFSYLVHILIEKPCISYTKLWCIPKENIETQAIKNYETPNHIQIPSLNNDDTIAVEDVNIININV